MKGIFLPLKFTSNAELTKNFNTHITKKYNKEAAASVNTTFEEMQRLRNGLDFTKVQLQINNDYRLAPEFEIQIINYLRYVYLVDNFFKNDFLESRYLKVNFTWTDSFQPTKKPKSINNIKFELASCLYNLAICYYTEGINYAAVPSPPEMLKGIAKLRNAIWCINEVKQVLPSLLVNPSELPSDLNLSYINLLHNYFTGLTYSALVGVMSMDTKKNGPEKLASVNKAAAKYFQIAHDIISTLKQSPIPEPQSKNLRMNLLYNLLMFRSEAYYNIAQIHIKNVDEEIRKGHMGFAVSYLRIPKTDFDELFKKKGDLEVLTPEQKAELVERAKLIGSTYDNCYLRNQKVYKQTEYSADQLAEIPEEKAQITPIEPKDIKKKLDDENSFEIFLSPEILALKNEFSNYVSMKMLDVENNLKNINNVKNKLYADGYVNYLLDLDSQTGNKQFDIPPQLKAKIEKFKKNGAVNAYMFTRKNVRDLSGNCERLIHEVKGPLAAEKDEDEKLRKQFPQQWNRPYSEQVNQEYVLKLRDLEQKFFIAQNTDTDIFKKFDQYQDWMQKFSIPDQQILALIPRSTDTEFVTNNRSKLNELTATDRKIHNLIDLEIQRANLLQLTDEFTKSDFLPSLLAINAKQADKQAEFDKLLIPYKNKLVQVENQINEAYPLIDIISNQAKEINSTRSESNQSAVKVLEEMSLAITVINEIYSDIQQGLNFYSLLSSHLATLQKVVGDFCFAREIEKNALLQDLQAQKSYENNFNAPKPYFQEQNMQFTKGKSEFVPINQIVSNQPKPSGPAGMNSPPVQSQAYYPQGQNQGHNAPVQSQAYNPHQHAPIQSQAFNPQQHAPVQSQAYYPQQGNNASVQSQAYNPHQHAPVQSQAFNPQQHTPVQSQAYYPQNQNYNAPVQSQTYHPQQGHNQGYNQNQTQTQMYNPGNQQGQQNKNPSYMNNNAVSSQMGYMPLAKPEGQDSGAQFAGFGNLVESTFVGMPSNQGGNPYYNQGKGPGQH